MANIELGESHARPGILEHAVSAALSERGFAVLTLPGDVGGLDLPKPTPVPRFVKAQPVLAPDPDAVQAAADAVNAADSVTFLVGLGARHARAEVLQAAERPAAPMVLTLKAKEGFDDDNPYEIGQSGLIGNPSTALAFASCDVLVLIGTDFPYPKFLPTGKTVVQLDVRGAHIGRRVPVDHAVVGDARLGLGALLPLLHEKLDRGHLHHARKAYELGDAARSTSPTRTTTTRRWGGCDARSTIPTPGSDLSCSRAQSRSTRTPRRSSPVTRGCQPSG